MNAHSTDAEDKQDVVVMRTGPGSGTLAGRLARTGKRTLLLQRGDYLKRERANWVSRKVFTRGCYTTAEPPKTGAVKRAVGPHYYVGGNSKVYGAALFRLTPADAE
ncbi:hypothetical protein B5P43_36465 [Bacillus sp. SRB_336]|nr:hypothetical protein B5P43_36465 [Bacillus sp. SRB_336]